MTRHRSGTTVDLPTLRLPVVDLRPDEGSWVRLARGLAAMRVVLGTSGLIAPGPSGRVWIGGGASGADRAVIVRALGGRDIALGAGALVAGRRGDLSRWVALGALSDLIDTLATALGFGALPRRLRWAVLAASGCAAALGALTARRLTESG